MSGAPTGKKQQSRGELETARTLNTVAIVGASHPIYTASRKLADDTGVTRTAGRLVPASAKRVASAASERGKRVVQSNPVSRTAANFARKHGKAAAIASGLGWMGFHGTELAGDFMGRRSINRQLDQVKAKEGKAVKSDHGTNLEFVAKRRFDAEADRQRRIGMYSGLLAGSALVSGDAARRRLVVSRHDASGKEINAEARLAAARKKPLKDAAKQAAREAEARGTMRVGIKGSGRTAALLGGAAALSAIGSGAAYRHGISERNKPWN